MKKKTILLLNIFVAIAATVFSQTNRISGGIVAGANYSYLNTSDEITGINYDWKWKFGPAGGIYLTDWTRRQKSKGRDQIALLISVRNEK